MYERIVCPLRGDRLRNLTRIRPPGRTAKRRSTRKRRQPFLLKMKVSGNPTPNSEFQDAPSTRQVSDVGDGRPPLDLACQSLASACTRVVLRASVRHAEAIWGEAPDVPSHSRPMLNGSPRR